jgi:hypothetical protein
VIGEYLNTVGEMLSRQRDPESFVLGSVIASESIAIIPEPVPKAPVRISRERLDCSAAILPISLTWRICRAPPRWLELEVRGVKYPQKLSNEYLRE